MTQEEYNQLLENADWKVFRLEILVRDKFRCTNCANKEIIINKKINFRKLHFLYIPYEVESDNSLSENQPEYTIVGKFDSRFLWNKISLAEYINLTRNEN